MCSSILKKASRYGGFVNISMSVCMHVWGGGWGCVITLLSIAIISGHVTVPLFLATYIHSYIGISSSTLNEDICDCVCLCMCVCSCVVLWTHCPLFNHASCVMCCIRFCLSAHLLGKRPAGFITMLAAHHSESVNNADCSTFKICVLSILSWTEDGSSISSFFSCSRRTM